MRPLTQTLRPWALKYIIMHVSADRRAKILMLFGVFLLRAYWAKRHMHNKDLCTWQQQYKHIHIQCAVSDRHNPLRGDNSVPSYDMYVAMVMSAARHKRRSTRARAPRYVYQLCLQIYMYIAVYIIGCNASTIYILYIWHFVNACE